MEQYEYAEDILYGNYSYKCNRREIERDYEIGRKKRLRKIEEKEERDRKYAEKILG